MLTDFQDILATALDLNTNEAEKFTPEWPASKRGSETQSVVRIVPAFIIFFAKQAFEELVFDLVLFLIQLIRDTTFYQAAGIETHGWVNETPADFQGY